ncbi:uncharacterized protein [Diadema antillarum]|uniref:uncharacterized protein n=1 Tax=Diadema antillarum TaxID=105358 RepID=UPI003A83F2F2
MGCGNSAPNSVVAESQATLSSSSSRPGSKTNQTNKSLESVGRQNAERSDSRTSYRDSGIDSAKTSDGQRRRPHQTAGNVALNNDSTLASSSGNDGTSPRKKGLAFEVMMDNDTDRGESIIAKHPPKRLQKLELRREPTLTAEMIEEKQRISEERRRQVMEERGKSSKKSSRRRKELLAAQQFGNIQQSSEQTRKLEEKIDSASKNRAKAQADVIAKQKKRELRAKQAKERLRRMKEEEEEDCNFDMEKDENFNADDELDSWLDGENNMVIGSASTTSERIYNGRSSPVKRISTGGKVRGRSIDVDSDGDEDQGWAGKPVETGPGTQPKDDFFDT